MKKIIFIFSVIQVFITVVNAVTSSYGKICPEECATVIDICLDENKVKGTFTPYPPEGNLGKCFCKDPNAYLTCLNCFNTKNNKNAVVAAQLNIYCNKLNGVTATTAAGATATTAGTANTANQKNSASSSNNSGTGTTLLTTGTSDDKTSTDTKKSGGGSMGFIIVGAVAAVGVVGYVFYSRKQKERPESMPFFGNSAASPNQYATLNTPKDMPMSESTNNMTSDYNPQFFSDATNVDNSNQYYNQSSNAYSYDQSQNQYGNQYDSSYQSYNNQYPSTTYENEIAGTAVATTASANYESRRESMMPNSQPTSTNVNGIYIVAYKYDPQLDDELELQVNDQVQIIEEYEDGWMKATNLTTGKEGMAPRVCIKEA